MTRLALWAALLIGVGCSPMAPSLTIDPSRQDPEHEAVIHRLYTAFSQGDAEAMAACYTEDVVFWDYFFGELRGAEVGAMWAMLCDAAPDLRVEHWDVRADAERGRAHWEAFYTFGVTGQRVHNRIDARFTFRDGRIAEHRDYFDAWRWTRMAIPYLGDLLGWSPVLTAPLGWGVRGALDAWLEAHPPPGS